MTTESISKKVLEKKRIKKTEIIDVSIESLRLARWDIRREDKKDEELESLKNSISEHGLFHPLTVARMRNSEKFTVMAGKRRFNALKELEWRQVPVNVVLEDATETDIRIIKINENLQRNELEEVEAGFAILGTYESKGYTNQQEVIKGVKSIDNWFNRDDNKGKTWYDLFAELEELSSSNSELDEFGSKRGRGRPLESKVREDRKFLETCKSIAKTPKWQYQLLQTVVQLHPDVLIEAQKAGLPIKKKMLLTHSKLRKHPEIQKNLIKKILPLSDEEAAYEVRQEITNIETGYYKQDDSGQYWYSGKPKEVVPKDAERSAVEKIPTDFDIVGATYDIIKLLTGRVLSKGEFKYTNNIIDKNKEKMYKIVKSCTNPRQLVAIADSLDVTKYAIDEMLKIVDAELNVIKSKKELSNK